MIVPTSASPRADPNMPWCARSTEEVVAAFGVDPERGLTDELVAMRRAQVGENTLTIGSRRSAFTVLLAQYRDVMVLVRIARTS